MQGKKKRKENEIQAIGIYFIYGLNLHFYLLSDRIVPSIKLFINILQSQTTVI